MLLDEVEDEEVLLHRPHRRVLLGRFAPSNAAHQVCWVWLVHVGELVVVQGRAGAKARRHAPHHARVLLAV